mmetsp:Transcript_44132/g.42841  ORF Transcript_44132/g.42841 Transcript_44132/m.42841 type:complete len:131 (-) Transcript_44132:984-1376(-)
MKHFIREYVVSYKFESNASKFLILDFLFQLCYQAFSETQNGVEKYSLKAIQELRQKIYQQEVEFKKAKQEQREQAYKNIVEDEEQKKKEDKVVEGYKSEAYNKDSTHFQDYMERPEEVCTFARTRKDFSH